MGQYDAVETASDSSSITDNGERPQSVDLSACRTQAMAQDWVAWYLAQLKDEWRTVRLVVPWVGKVLDGGDTFSLTWDFWDGVTWDIVNYEIDPQRERVTIYGQEWPT